MGMSHDFRSNLQSLADVNAVRVAKQKAERDAKVEKDGLIHYRDYFEVRIEEAARSGEFQVSIDITAESAKDVDALNKALRQVCYEYERAGLDVSYMPIQFWTSATGYPMRKHPYTTVTIGWKRNEPEPVIPTDTEGTGKPRGFFARFRRR